MKLRFIKVNPSGNTTIFILDPVAKDQRAAVGDAVMAYENVGAEQVGFIVADREQASGWRMEMAGGEFCGNASRSFAAWLSLCPDGGAPRGLGAAERDQVISVSGAAQPLTAHLVGMEEDNCCYAMVDMPLPRRILTGRDPWFGEYSLVIFDGISHLVVWDHKPQKEDVAKMRELLEVSGPMPDAFGILYYEADGQFMSPLVYVEETGTLVWERSCGSGSSALACALAHRAGHSLDGVVVRQPGGELKVDVTWSGDQVERLQLGGVIEFTAVGELFVRL